MHGLVASGVIPFPIESGRAETGMPQIRLHVAQVTARIERVVRVSVPQPVAARPSQIGRGAWIGTLALLRGARKDAFVDAG